MIVSIVFCFLLEVKGMYKVGSKIHVFHSLPSVCRELGLWNDVCV